MVQDKGGGDPSFEDRLQTARRRQGLDALPGSSKEKDELGGSAWSIGLRVGIELVSAMLVAVAIGYGLDRLFHTTPILTAVFVPIGGAAGVLNLWRMLAPKPDRKTE
jgi:ATP synthase protein I